MAEVIWMGPAQQEFERIIEYIALDRPQAAATTAGRIVASVERLRNFPLSGKRVPGFSRDAFRMIWAAPVHVFYRVDGNKVLILHVQRAERLFSAEDLLGG